MKEIPEKPSQAEEKGRSKPLLKILLAEDSHTQARKMKTLLEAKEFTVTLAHNGRHALELLKEEPPDLVISDVVMPEMDGYDLCREIRADPELTHLPVMLLTSLSQPEDIFRGLDCGADNFVAKPFDADYLLHRIHFLVINSEFRNKDRMDFGLEVNLGGRRHFVSASRVQILHHLLSTYETATIKSRELEKAQRALRSLNAQLEAKVRERTASLEAEVEERTKAQKAVAHRLRLEETFASISSRFINLPPEDLEKTIFGALRELGEAVDVDFILLWLLDEKKTAVVLTHLWSRTETPAPYEQGAEVALEDFPWWFERMKKGQVISTSDVHTLPPEASVAEAKLDQFQSLLIVPLYAEPKQFIGGLGFATLAERKEWLPADVTLIKMVAEVLCKAMEHRKTQELLREQADLLDLATDAIVVRDMEGRVRFWNRGAEKIYGWRRQEVIGKEIPEGFYRDRQQLDEARRVLLKKGEWHGEMPHLDRNNRELIVSKQWTLVRDAANKPKGVLSIGTDVTESKRMEKNFYEAQKQESIGNLASGIAHDFNNLLAVINGYSEMIIEGAASDPTPFAREVLAAGRRAESLVRQILTFARKGESTFETIEISKVVEDLAGVVEKTFPKRIGIHLDLERNLPPISGDATQIYQVFMNLLVNARDAIDHAGDIRITGRLRSPRAPHLTTSSSVDYLCLEVSDTGSGIPPEIQARIFDPFFTSKPKGEGTGLGLAVVDGIVKSHGGMIELESSIGHGSTFRVFFPALNTRPAGTPAKQKEQTAKKGEQETVLVVDDEPAIRGMIEVVLTGHGYRVIAAQDGLDALSLLEQEKEVDLIVADLDMPRSSGEELLLEVKRRNIKSGFLLLSGYLPQERLENLKKKGLEWHLLKPLSMRDLLGKVATILSHTKREN